MLILKSEYRYLGDFSKRLCAVGGRLSRVKLTSMNSKNIFWPKNGPPIGQENLCMTGIKPVYVVYQTCVRGFFFDPSCNKKAPAKNAVL